MWEGFFNYSSGKKSSQGHHTWIGTQLRKELAYEIWEDAPHTERVRSMKNLRYKSC